MIQVIHRALDVIEYLAKEPQQIKSLGEIATDLNLNSSTCSHILKTLADRNYVERLDKQKGYRLGTMLEGFTGQEGYQKKIIDVAKEELKALTKQLNENTILAVLKNSKRVVILSCNGEQDIQANTTIEKSAYAAASGRLLVAMLADEAIEKHLEKYGLPTSQEWEEALDKTSFLAQVAMIRAKGYATQRTIRQIIGLAVPVFQDKKVVASVSVYMPLLRFDNLDEHKIITLLKQTAERISQKLK